MATNTETTNASLYALGGPAGTTLRASWDLAMHGVIFDLLELTSDDLVRVGEALRCIYSPGAYVQTRILRDIVREFIATIDDGGLLPHEMDED